MPAPKEIEDLFAELRREIADLKRAQGRLTGTGLSVPSPGVVEVSGDMRLVDGTGALLSSSFDGTDFAHPGTAGNYFGDDGVVLNNAYFRPGSVTNDALTNPVVPGSVWRTASGFTISPTWNTVINYNLTVPAGVTAAAIHAQARVTAYYNNAGTGTGVDYLYGDLFVGSADSGFYGLAVTDNGGSGTNHVFVDTVATGLTPGASINFQFQVSSDYATWTGPTTPGNKATVGASVQWYR